MAAAGRTNGGGGGLDACQAARMYIIQKCMEEVQGMKALLLDEETSASVGLVVSHMEALKNQVYAIDVLDNPMRKAMGQIRAVCIVRPTLANIKVFRREFEQPKFEEYHIFFTNTLPDHLLKDLALADVESVVKQVQEIFMDYFPLTPDLFSLNVNSCMPLIAPRWDQALFNRICDGLTSVLLALKRCPVISYQKNSPVAEKIALEIESRIASGNHTADKDLFTFGSKGPPALLLILDRRDDPVTPLLNQWNYTSMLHEAFTIRNNRIDLSATESAKEVGAEITLNVADDDFFKSAQFLIFGELGEAIKKVAEDFQNSEGGALTGGNRAKLQSLKDIQRLMDRFPQLQRQKTTLAKHLALTSELSKLVDARRLMDMSELEQELACTEGLTEAFNRVETMIEDKSVSDVDKLRMVLLYALRYELEGDRETRFLERSLKDVLLDPRKALRKYAGVNVRGSDIFNKQTALGMARSIVRRNIDGIKGIDNILTRHEPLLASRLAALKMAGISALRESEFKVLGAGARSCPRPQEIIIFVVGGATYAESKIVADFNRDNAGKGMRVILGSNTIHNSTSFVEDVIAFGEEPSSSEGSRH